MTKIQSLLEEYGSSHQNATNKLIHWVCVPLIFFSIIGLLYSVELPVAITVALGERLSCPNNPKNEWVASTGLNLADIFYYFF